MAHAFLAHLIGEEPVKIMRGMIEASVHEADDDEFAEVHGLI